ncbi:MULTISPECIES: Pycsar system effector family protein [Streptomyces]|nr:MULTISPECIES: Pycsar system effector family protein [Streptomyces]
MSEPSGNSGAHGPVWCSRLEPEADGMFQELQRADMKAAILCGLIGGLLTADAALLSTMPKSAWVPMTALVGVAGLLGAALMMTMWAIRPVLPPDGKLRIFACLTATPGRAETAEADAVAPEADRHQLLQAERLALFTTLAQRKFRILRCAVDVTMAALSVSGAALLILYITI